MRHRPLGYSSCCPATKRSAIGAIGQDRLQLRLPCKFLRLFLKTILYHALVFLLAASFPEAAYGTSSPSYSKRRPHAYVCFKIPRYTSSAASASSTALCAFFIVFPVKKL